MTQGLISPKLDVVFKTLFVRNQDLLVSFVAAILGKEPDSIRDLKVINPELPPDLPDKKFSRLDLNLIMNDQQVNIEIQIKKYPDYCDRSLFYWAKLFTSGLDSGEEYGMLRKTVTVNILDFNIFDDPEDYYTEVVPTIHRTGQVFSDKMSIRFVELKKFRDYTGTDLLTLWLRFLNAESKEDLDMIKSAGNEAINKAIVTICEMSADDRIREQARMREKALHDEASLMNGARREGIAEGEAKGRIEGRTEGLTEGLICSVKGIISRFGVNREDALQIAQVPPEYRQAVIAGL